MNLIKSARSFLTRKVIKFYDPVVTRKVGNNILLHAKLSHKTSNESDIIRICESIVKTYGHLSMIDIGANVGAVVLCVYDHLKQGSYLAIEGNKNFTNLLRKNLTQIPNASLKETFLSDQIEAIKIDVHTSASTGNVQPSQTGTEEKFTTLDEIYSNHQQGVNFIKIDTDGYDYKILRGFNQTLKANHNLILYFEYSPIHQVLHRVESKPEEIFNYLAGFGYDTFYFYDKAGLLFAKIDLNQDLITQLSRYCFSSITHFNVLTFHKSNSLFRTNFEIHENTFTQKIIENNWGERWSNRLQ